MSTQTINDRYAVTGPLDTGGGGSVWRATDEVLARTVAVKEVGLPAHLPDEDRQRLHDRAVREATSAARIVHRSVVTVYEVVDATDVLYIVMEHVDAPSLAQVVAQEGPLPIQRVATIGLDVLDGLAAAHAGGVVHGDIKPSNILVPMDGPAVVTDLGIGAARDRSRRPGGGEGPPPSDYASPEQLREGSVGPSTDMWSLGASLYHAVEGVAPFASRGAEDTLHAIVSEDLRPPAHAGELGVLLGRLLERDPDRRMNREEARWMLLEVVGSNGRRPAPTVAGRSSGRALTGSRGPVPPTGSVPPPPDPATAVPGRPPVPTGLRVGPPVATAAEGVAAEHVAAADVAAAGTPGPTWARGRSLAALVVLCLVVTLGAVLWSLEGSPDVDIAAGDGPDASSQTSGPDGGVSEPTRGEQQAVVPPDTWVEHDGGSFSVAVPETWEAVDRPDGVVELRSIVKGAHLRVTETDTPSGDLLGDTEARRRELRIRAALYEEISLEQVEYRGAEAVRWEYTYLPGSRTLHVVELSFDTDDRGYVLSYQTPASIWADVGDRFEYFRGTFSPR